MMRVVDPNQVGIWVARSLSITWTANAKTKWHMWVAPIYWI